MIETKLIDPQLEKGQLLDKACEIVVAFLNKNEVKLSEIPEIIVDVHRTLTTLFGNDVPVTPGIRQVLAAPASVRPAVDIAASVTPDYIICLEDGKKLKTLKRYIGGRFGLSPEQYRAKWNLPANYPMVSPNYATKRSKLAKSMGLGRKRAPKRSSKKR